MYVYKVNVYPPYTCTLLLFPRNKKAIDKKNTHNERKGSKNYDWKYKQ